MENEQLNIALKGLKTAKDNLARIRNEYKENIGLLRFYEPSALKLVSYYENIIKETIHETTGDKITFPEDPPVDIWVKFEGKSFTKGEGPINVVGTFLSNLNAANRYALNILNGSGGKYQEFNLIAVGTGSLQIGLKEPNAYINENRNQMTLEDPWEQIKKISIQKNKTFEGFNLIIKTIASALNEEKFQDLINEYDKNRIIKLLGYAMQLTPGKNSKAEKIVIESKAMGLPDFKINLSKSVRSILADKAKALRLPSQTIEGYGTVRALDLDNYSLTLRPFETKNYSFKELVGIVSPYLSSHEIVRYVDKKVVIDGSLVYSPKNQPSRVEINNIRTG